MLRELHITNLAIIEDAAIELRGGLNCFTGQTGAGKSLVIGAFEVLLGLRSAADLLRDGAEEGRVSGVFELSDGGVIEQINAAADAGLDAQRGDQLLITRKLFASGRTSVSINGRPATTAMLRTVGELLVDVHGQHDHQYLLKPGNQLMMLDRFGECEPLREQFAHVHGQLQSLRRRRAELEASATLRRQQLELYEFQADEIDQADPVEGEWEELNARHRLLSNLSKVSAQAGEAHAALYEAEGAAVERLQAIVGVLRELSELDEDLKPIAEDVRNATAQLQDAAFCLGRYVSRLDLDPNELAEVEQRLNTLNRLIHKYSPTGRGGTLADVLNHRDRIHAEIARLRSESDDLAGLDAQAAPLEAERAKIGTALSKQRRAAAERLKPLIEAELAELGMAEAKFDAAFETIDPDADDSSADHVAACGFDAVEMLVQANPGQPGRPLRKVASGGELSRIMLALKSILAQSDRISVLVFDEIDANIGGRMGGVIGDKLRRLAEHHQVLCITHLPQIAAYADHHLRISKQILGGQTRTTVTPLDAASRIDELAEMLTGKNATETTRRQAVELLKLAEASKAIGETSAKPARGRKGHGAANVAPTIQKRRSRARTRPIA